MNTMDILNIQGSVILDINGSFLFYDKVWSSPDGRTKRHQFRIKFFYEARWVYQLRRMIYINEHQAEQPYYMHYKLGNHK